MISELEDLVADLQAQRVRKDAEVIIDEGKLTLEREAESFLKRRRNGLETAKAPRGARAKPPTSQPQNQTAPSS